MSSQYTPNLEAELFDYELPEAAIALHPAEPRSAAKMLVWKKGQQNLNACFTDLPSILPQDSQLWVNNTRVIRARLLLQKPTGGRLEVFLLEPDGSIHGTVLGLYGSSEMEMHGEGSEAVVGWAGKSAS